ncbi:acyl carrier protein [Paludisphaera rhizosphaerae]|uniref:acyl carrier protein n=1 Tax=Paludisphaera rhizosphaerae TaxID=2711216 RepID=UPI0013EC414F|nr:acyl carrier protein [Paludisphaera rhizosphaerae]
MSIHQRILDEVLTLMTELSADWEYSGEITAETRLLGDLAMDSLDLVILGSELQERYGQLPFSEFLAELGKQDADQRDVTIGELVDLICRQQKAAAPGGVA